MTGWFAANYVLIQTSLIYIMIALSFHVVLRSGVFAFSSVGFFGLGAYTVGILTRDGIPGWLAFFVALVGAAVLGTVLGILLRKLRGLYLGLFTIAFNMILIVLYRNGGEFTGGTVGIFGVPEIMPLWAVAVVVALAVLVVWRLSRSSVGRSFEALRLNEDLARSSGVEVTRRRVVVFALSAVLGAAAGALNVSAFTTVVPTTAGFHLVTLGLTMVVLGGIRSWQGAIVGALFVALLPAWLGPFQQFQIIINGVIIVVLVVYAPGGLSEVFARLVAWMRRRIAPVAAPEFVTAETPESKETVS